MNWKEFAHDYFVFTRKERIGLLVLVSLILGIWISPTFIGRHTKSETITDTAWIGAVLQLERQKSGADSDFAVRRWKGKTIAQKDSSGKASTADRFELFFFDPNTISPADWLKLGVREKTIATIQKYLAKGGHFYRADDIKKIFGLSSSEVSRLLPYVKIAASEKINPGRIPREIIDPGHKTVSISVDVNEADSAALIALPGIGSKLASRIINFRKKLGGFYSVDQIGETYGLPDSTFQKIKAHLRVGAVSLVHININAASKDELKMHPYIRWNLANAIVEYRNQHGNFASIEDLKKLASVTDEIFNKMVHYISVR